jgi:hypoxanthine phosphoribosyltransferase
MKINRRLRESAPPHHTNEVAITAERIQARVETLVAEMVEDCRGEDLVMIGILRGSFMFLADLVRALYEKGVHPRIDFMTLSSYGAATESSGHVEIRKDISVDVNGADVLLIDDILDTGRTLSFACAHLTNKGAHRIKTCALLDKPSRRVIPCEADYVGFTIEDMFVVGYGLDFDSCYRELPYIAKVTFN